MATAESAIRSLVGDAASTGDYDEVLTLTSLAKAVANLAKSVGTTRRAEATHASTTPKNGAELSRAKRATNGRVRPKRRKVAVAGSYPRFVQSDGELVKIGWSKSASKEYQHKAPRDVLDVVADVIKVQGLDNGVLGPPQGFLPLSTASGEPIPDYQSYLCLAWLRDIGIVERQGRHGYKVSDPASIGERIDQAWNELSRA